jgi:hypothetical protein
MVAVCTTTFDKKKFYPLPAESLCGSQNLGQFSIYTTLNEPFLQARGKMFSAWYEQNLYVSFSFFGFLMCLGKC